MDLIMLLNAVANVSNEEKEEVLEEEYRRQKLYVDTVCEMKRRETNL